MRHGIISTTDEAGTWRWAQRHYQVCRKKKTSKEITGYMYTVAGISDSYFDNMIGDALTYTPLYSVSGIDIDIQIDSSGSSLSSIEPHTNAAVPANSRVILYQGESAESAKEIWIADALSSTPYISDWSTAHIMTIYRDEGTSTARDFQQIGTCSFSPEEQSLTRQHFIFSDFSLTLEKIHAIQADLTLRHTSTIALQEIPYTATLSIS